MVSGQDKKKIRESSRMRRASPSAKFANRIFSGVRPRLRLIASAAPFGVGRTGKNAGEFFGSSLHVYVFRFSVSDFRFWLDGWVGWMWKRSTQITQTQALRPCSSLRDLALLPTSWVAIATATANAGQFHEAKKFSMG